MTEPMWTRLTPRQADGLVCVICHHSYHSGGGSGPQRSAVPVGRSHTGSQVFACVGDCAARAGELARAVAIPDQAWTAAGAAFLTAVDAAGGDLHAAYPDDVVTATVTAAAPLIVAAELRRLAGGAHVQHWPSAFNVMVALVPVADLTARADALDPAGGERQ